MQRHKAGLLILIVVAGTSFTAAMQQPSAVIQQPPAPERRAVVAGPPALPAGYVIGTDDVLSIKFWKDADMSAETIMVRPDGKISLPLLNEVHAAGLTPEQLRAALMEAAAKYVEDPNVTVVVKEIRSRNIFITGNVARPGAFSLTSEMNVLQALALAGGLSEFADVQNIVVIRMESGRQDYHKFNYKHVVQQKNPGQNIALRPGDTIVVP